jgi:hypothetical protein
MSADAVSGHVQRAHRVFKRLVLRHAVDRPPFSIAALSFQALNALNDAVIEVVFKDLSELMFALTRDQSRLASVGVRVGQGIEQLSFYFAGGTVDTTGRAEGEELERFVLDAGEYIVKVRCFSIIVNGTNCLGAIQFDTNTTRQSPIYNVKCIPEEQGLISTDFESDLGIIGLVRESTESCSLVVGIKEPPLVLRDEIPLVATTDLPRFRHICPCCRRCRMRVAKEEPRVETPPMIFTDEVGTLYVFHDVGPHCASYLTAHRMLFVLVILTL